MESNVTMDMPYALVANIVTGLDAADLAFTVQAGGAVWDVYRFAYAGLPGTLALRIVDEVTVVGLFVTAICTREEVARRLERRPAHVVAPTPRPNRPTSPAPAPTVGLADV